MALRVQQGSIALTAGDNTITLPAQFAPKALMVGVGLPFEGSVASWANWSHGLCTYRAAAVQQAYAAGVTHDALSTGDTHAGVGSAGVGRVYTGYPCTVGNTVTLVSMSDTSIVLNAGATVTVYYLALGGDDLADAYTGILQLGTSVATQDVALPAGFGQPDLLVFLPTHRTTVGDGRETMQAGMGFAASDTERWCSYFLSLHLSADCHVVGGGKARAILTQQGVETPTEFDAEVDLDAKASWPTDGFRLAFAKQATRANQVPYLALKGTFGTTIGAASSLTSGSPQTLASDVNPTGLVVASALVPPAAISTTDSRLGGLSVGFSDMASHAAYAQGSDDAPAASTSISWRAYRKDRALYSLSQPVDGTSAPVERAGAYATPVAGDVSLTYSAYDNVARQFGYLILGDNNDPAFETDAAIEGARTSLGTAGVVAEYGEPRVIASGVGYAISEISDVRTAYPLAPAPAYSRRAVTPSARRSVRLLLPP